MKIYTIKEDTKCTIDGIEETETYYDMKFSENELFSSDNKSFTFWFSDDETITFKKQDVKVESWNE